MMRGVLEQVAGVVSPDMGATEIYCIAVSRASVATVSPRLEDGESRSHFGTSPRRRLALFWQSTGRSNHASATPLCLHSYLHNASANYGVTSQGSALRRPCHSTWSELLRQASLACPLLPSRRVIASPLTSQDEQDAMLLYRQGRCVRPFRLLCIRVGLFSTPSRRHR